MRNLYPFTAVVGLEHVKKALILNLIEPAIGGILFSGQKGTAKSTLVRSIESLSDKRVVNVPLNVTEDRLVGSVDIEHVLSTGEIKNEVGLLESAKNQILYVDEINLLSDNLTNLIIEASAYENNFILIGSMNPEEGQIKQHFMDRFGFFVHVEGTDMLNERVEIIKRCLAYDENPDEFLRPFKKDLLALKTSITKAQERYKSVIISEEIITWIGKLCLTSLVSGHRADLVTVLASKAHAAYMGKRSVDKSDVEAVINYVLGHRLREKSDQEIPPNKEQSGNQSEDNKQTHTQVDVSQVAMKEQINEECFEIDETFNAKEILKDIDTRLKVMGPGRRHKTRINASRGRYIKSRFPKGNLNDIALDATLRQAAPYQKYREKDGLFVNIHKEDIRVKIREDRVGNLIMFLVDASGSMGVNKRMSTAKGAIYALLKDAYQKRDTVGLMTFRGDKTELVLNPTRSIDLAYKKLTNIKTGGKTPLSLGVKNVVDFLKAQRSKYCNLVPIVIVISDGRGNVSYSEKKFIEEIMEVSKKAESEEINFVVVDSESGFISLGLAKEMAENLNAVYMKLDDLREDDLLKTIQQLS
ncbi:VWA domain-containing protein [Acidaminobacter sp. JC074]|uniref:VWA domain-containing protein n=1 Tax=Acidaminobacter sp. JC074 TaxID=2530199 RepID=UPI001F0E0A18|nr:VWA domain-containing protein [Acidaminobacter sp. JC074]MCH4886558.1 VWA domain-containing protein [Acidaminobacter sp. JC074]